MNQEVAQALVAFRVDASNRIGTGHVMRCLTLAQAMRRRGAHCVFLHRQHDGHLCALIERAGFEVLTLPKPERDIAPAHAEDYAAWLGLPAEEDARQCLHALAARRAAGRVVDLYAVDSRWESQMRAAVDQILVIDDLANRGHDCDLLIDQNYFPDAIARYRPLVGESTPVLAGPRYALLARGYAEARAEMPELPSQVRRVLVYYGGVDASNETARALRVLGAARYHELQIDVVVGPNNPNRDEIERLAARHPAMTVHGPQNDLVDLMLAADLTLGAGGATTWERCALGLPSIVTSVAANQEPYNRLLQADGIITYLGDSADVTDDILRATLDEVIHSPEQLNEMAASAWRLVDGLGTNRVAEAMIPEARNSAALERK
ncbi:MAG: UDP-2,4-diacetamido-2,4,6-trideoxy-beta-L-altropyranose hydrolase [Wenzhouxiangella sp.]|nr:UDP-2,4-diacetamido-2,4,6-trideoxy-beta-L-altropyranose hydrolase [Wenzhouxiangella sp.]